MHQWTWDTVLITLKGVASDVGRGKHNEEAYGIGGKNNLHQHLILVCCRRVVPWGASNAQSPLLQQLFG